MDGRTRPFAQIAVDWYLIEMVRFLCGHLSWLSWVDWKIWWPAPTTYSWIPTENMANAHRVNTSAGILSGLRESYVKRFSVEFDASGYDIGGVESR